MIRSARKDRLHTRNRARTGYDFTALAAASPALAACIAPNAHGDLSIDYADPNAVKALNQALLKHDYDVTWDLPPDALCPPVPGRAEYLHHLADLLHESDQAPPGEAAVILDIGTGANCIFPLIGASEYGWRFVATEVDPAALAWAQRLVADNPRVSALIDCRRQTLPLKSFAAVVRAGETFAASMCNPPFHASADEAIAGTRRKRRHLGASRLATTVRNFGGGAGELWCEGGEVGFIERMIAESAARPDLCRWFTTLVSKSAHLPRLRHALTTAGAIDIRTIAMTVGQKQTRMLAWRFDGARQLT